MRSDMKWCYKRCAVQPLIPLRKLRLHATLKFHGVPVVALLMAYIVWLSRQSALIRQVETQFTVSTGRMARCLESPTQGF